MDWDAIFYYNENTPSCLTFKVDFYHARRKNEIRYHKDENFVKKNSHGYYQLSYNGKKYLAHHIVLILNGFKINKNDVVDHIDGNKENNKIDNLRITTVSENNRNKTKNKNNTSGVTGVIKNKGKNYWAAVAQDLDGNRVEKCFNIRIHGEEEAFRLACEHRAKIIKELNEQGANYTERHGKE